MRVMRLRLRMLLRGTHLCTACDDACGVGRTRRRHTVAAHAAACCSVPSTPKRSAGAWRKSSARAEASGVMHAGAYLHDQHTTQTSRCWAPCNPDRTGPASPLQPAAQYLSPPCCAPPNRQLMCMPPPACAQCGWACKLSRLGPATGGSDAQRGGRAAAAAPMPVQGDDTAGARARQQGRRPGARPRAARACGCARCHAPTSAQRAGRAFCCA